MSACEQGQQWRAVLRQFQEMLYCELLADSVTYNAVLSSCDKGTKWVQAVGVLEEMVARRCEVDAIAIDASMSACTSCKQWEQGAYIFHGLGEDVAQAASADVAARRLLLAEYEQRGMQMREAHILSQLGRSAAF